MSRLEKGWYSFEKNIRTALGWIDRTEWAVRLFRLSRTKGHETVRGLIMIQIDGLSRGELERALAKNSMPFISRLLKNERYTLHSHYSGLPSNTPAVQGELFYGVKGCVPAFSFLDRQTGRVFRMYDRPAASEVEARLKEKGKPLIEGGSSYSNIFTGGAAEAHYCASDPGFGGLLWAITPFRFPLLILLHMDVLVRLGILMVFEFILAVRDCLMGVLRGKRLMEELPFIFSRLGPVILLRELVVLGAQMDAARGLPVVHLNLIGYDDHAHRRGPRSAFSRWPLAGIDSSIERVWRVAKRSTRRDYEVWVYSDHGQALVTPYADVAGMSLLEAVKKGCEAVMSSSAFDAFGEYEYRYWPQRGALGKRPARNPPPAASSKPSAEDAQVRVAAMGPLGHVYLQAVPDRAPVDKLAQYLVQEAHVPLVMAPSGPGQARAWTKEGCFELPEDAARIVGKDHPFYTDIVYDLIALAHHPDAGALILFGWCVGSRALSFPGEHGAHAGFSVGETHGFALLPVDAPLSPGAQPYLRPTDIREAALFLLGRSDNKFIAKAARSRPHASIRLMTYNIHRCIGVDGKISPERIARVIARHDPDVVALQEVDECRDFTLCLDQTKGIAEALKMTHHFHPVINLAKGNYGISILSAHPMRVVKADRLPQFRDWRYFERRGAVWVEVLVHGIPIQVINCHLSVWAYERAFQVRALTGPEWAGCIPSVQPVILCGDLNAVPGSWAYRHLLRSFQDVERVIRAKRPQNTWYSRYPVSRLDHVFVSPGIRVTRVNVPRTHLDQVASDHLPLVVDMDISDARFFAGSDFSLR